MPTLPALSWPLFSGRRAQRPLTLAAAALLSASCGTSSGGAGGAATTGGSGAGALPAAQEAAAPDTLALANELIAGLADDSAAGAKFTVDSKAVEQVEGGCEPSSSGESGGGSGDPGSGPGGGPGGRPVEGCEGFDAQSSADDVKEWFKDSVLNEKFVETKLSSAKAVVVCAAAKDFCNIEVDEKGTETIDAKCAEGLAKVPVCLAISWHGGKLLSGAVVVGLDMAIKPATFQLTPDLFQVEVNLAEVHKAAQAVAAATGEALPEEFPTTMVGKIGAALTRSPGKVLTGSVSVVSDIHVAAFTAGDKRHYDVQVAAAKDALKLVVGKALHTIIGSAKFGTIDVKVATDLLFGGGDGECGSESPPVDPNGNPIPGGSPGGDCGPPPKALTGTLLAKLAGLTFDADFSVAADGKQDTLKVTGLSLGSTSATASLSDGGKVMPLGSVDLNADAGRKVDVGVVFDGENATLTTLPKLLIHVAHTLAPLAVQVEDVPKFLHAGSTALTFDGDSKPTFQWGGLGDGGGDAAPKPLPLPGGSDGGSGGGDGGGVEPEGSDMPPMKVILGLLTLKGAGIPVPPAEVMVKIKAGFCLGEAPGAGKGDAPSPDGKGGDGGVDSEQPHLFSELAEVVCK